MNLPENYLQDLLVRMTYHSIAIEEYDITPESAIAILLHKQTPPKLSKETINLVKNHRYAIELLVRKALNHEELSFSFLFQLHHLLMKHIDSSIGHFKTKANKMKANNFTTATPEDTPLLMKQSIDDINQKIASGLNRKDMIALICHLAIVLEHIQPFQSGNGLLIRLTNNFLLLREEIAPFIILEEDAERYRQLLIKQDTAGLTQFAEERIAEEEIRIESFR